MDRVEARELMFKVYASGLNPTRFEHVSAAE